ncbi:TonB-dependent receptor [Sphingomonas crusticola]|uniref:TonB-dependent receptor n=1 Tax=Sphingomonas crusticola TaxID=1697973 RepID=UPI000E266052|nr:TonB-dependent receptor [Sphingomonas crusticola]
MLFRFRTMNRLIYGAAASVALATPIAVCAQQSSFQLDIPAQDLGSALKALASAAGQQVVFKGASVRGRRSNALKGNYSIDDAIGFLIHGQGLQAGRSPRGIIVIKPAAAPVNGRTEAQEPSLNAGAPGRAGSGFSDESTADTSQEITVTGSRLLSINEQSSPSTTVNRTDFRLSGAQTVQAALATLSQTFAGDINPETAGGKQSNGFRSDRGSNGSKGYSPNLRGLGSAATLALIDGSRFPIGSEGAAPDVSMMPLVALDRIEVLRDGASPVYGADAVAGVVNLITKTHQDQPMTSVGYGGADGGYATYQASHIQGLDWNGGSGVLAAQYDKSDRLSTLDRAPTSRITPASILPDQHQYSIFGSLSQDVGGSNELRLKALGAQRKFSSPSSVLDFSRGNTKLGYVSASGIFRLPDSWVVSVNADFSANHLINQAQSLTGVYSRTDYRGHEVGAGATITGTPFSLPAGPVRTALGIDYRYSKREFVTQGAAGASLDRTVAATFGEIAVPLLRDAPLAKSVTLEAAVRYDHYSDFGGTTNSRVGLVWRVNSSIRLRATRSTSFRAPTLFDENAAGLLAATVKANDPQQGGLVTALLVTNGAYPDLKPETARNLTLGFDFTSQALPGMGLSVDYYDVAFRNRIAAPDTAVTTLFNLADPLVQPFLTRSPALSSVTSFFALPGFLSTTGPTTTPSDVRVIIDDRSVNLASTTAKGIDFLFHANLPTSTGALTFTADATLNLSFKVRAQPAAPEQEFTGQAFFAPRYRVRSGLAYVGQRFEAAAFLRYTPSMDDKRVVAGRPAGTYHIDDYTTADLHLGMLLGNARTGLKISLDVTNAFNKAPPYVQPISATYASYDPSNASVIGRVSRLTLTKMW